MAMQPMQCGLQDAGCASRNFRMLPQRVIWHTQGLDSGDLVRNLAGSQRLIWLQNAKLDVSGPNGPDFATINV